MSPREGCKRPTGSLMARTCTVQNLTVSCCLTMCTMRQEINVFRLNLCQTGSSSPPPTPLGGFLARERSEASEAVANTRPLRFAMSRSWEPQKQNKKSDSQRGPTAQGISPVLMISPFDQTDLVLIKPISFPSHHFDETKEISYAGAPLPPPPPLSPLLPETVSRSPPVRLLPSVPLQGNPLGAWVALNLIWSDRD